MGIKCSKEEEGNKISSCVICNAKANILLWPCGHLCLCSKCANKLSKFHQDCDCELVKCPICRSISSPTKVYIS